MTTPALIHSARAIIERHQAHRIDLDTGHLAPPGRKQRGKLVLMDAFTASMLTQIWDNVNEENRKKLADLAEKNILKTIELCWKVARRSQERSA